ncbi:hypothetical protein [Methylobacterium sp. A52T]
MLNDTNAANESLAPSIRARLIEVSQVRYLRNAENLTPNQREAADLANKSAVKSMKMRLKEEWYNDNSWIDRFSDWSIAAWAMRPDYDIFVDLLTQDKTHGRTDRIRLPGVSARDVEARIARVTAALEARLAEIEPRTAERERGR